MLQHHSEKARLRQFAMVDALTGIGNPRAFRMVLSKTVRQSKKTKEPLSLLDIDFLRRINYTYTFADGDRLLANLSCILQSVLRESDYLARTSGDGQERGLHMRWDQVFVHLNTILLSPSLLGPFQARGSSQRVSIRHRERDKPKSDSTRCCRGQPPTDPVASRAAIVS